MDSQSSEKEKREKRERNRIQFKAGLFLVFSLVFCSTTFYGYQILFSDNLLVDKKTKVLYIPTGADFKQVVDSLEKGEFLHDKLSFMFLSRLLGYRKNVIPGRYEIQPNTNNFKLLKMLIKGRQTPLMLTFNNIRTKKDLVKKFSRRLEIDSTSLMTVLSDVEYLQSIGFNDTTIMAMFIPNSYEVYWTWTGKQLVDFFYEEHKKFWTEERINKAKEIGFTPVQVVIMASIVEAETQKAEEKARIAGVYMNRYKAGQRLQADPTLIFATEDFAAKRVNEYHRYFKSPYNTYRVKGLPPGPINIPSITSIESVLNYEKHDYFFFCARPDLTGYHLFSKTFEDHLNVARDYWKSLNKANIHQEKRLDSGK